MPVAPVLPVGGIGPAISRQRLFAATIGQKFLSGQEALVV